MSHLSLTLRNFIFVAFACFIIHYSITLSFKTQNLHVGKKLNKLEVHGRARREAARRRKSECKVNLLSRNSSRSNESWRIAKSTKYSAAAIGAIGRRSDQ